MQIRFGVGASGLSPLLLQQPQLQLLHQSTGRVGGGAGECHEGGGESYAFVAALLRDGKEIGETEAIEGSSRLFWKKIFVLRCDNVQETCVDVVLYRVLRGSRKQRQLQQNDEGQRRQRDEIGRATFNVGSILNRNSKVHAVDLSAGDGDDGGGGFWGTIFAFAIENNIDRTCSFQFQISGQDLVNRSRLKFRVSDPFFEVRNASGQLVYVSEVKESDLNPSWSGVKIGLRQLCDGNFTALIRFDVYDKGHGDCRQKLMGYFVTNVNELALASDRGTLIALIKDDDEDGSRRHVGNIRVTRAACVGFISPAQVLKAASSTRALMRAASDVADAKAMAAAIASEDAEKARIRAENSRTSEKEALREWSDAQSNAERMKEEARKAVEEAERIRKRGLMGTLRLRFVGRDLKNVELFTFVDKSDPFFVLQKVASVDKGGKVDWSHVYISNVVYNDLNPEWDEAEIGVRDLCTGSLDEKMRVVVLDWNRSGKHVLIGSFETSVADIVAAAKKPDASFALTAGENGDGDGGGATATVETGRIIATKADLIDFIDPEEAERRAEKLSEEAENARFFAKGRERRAILATAAAEEAESAALALTDHARVASEEAEVARMRALEKTVSRRLVELGLQSS